MAATTNEILLKLRMVSDVSDVTGNVKQIQQVLNKIDMPKDLKQKFNGVFADLERETKNYQNLLNSGFKGKKDVTGLEASGKRINALMKTLETSMKGIHTEDLERSFKVDPASIQKLNKELTNAQTKLQTITSSSDFQKVTNDANKAAEAMSKISKTKFTGSFLESVKKGDIQGATEALRQLEANHKKLTGTLADGTSKEKAYETALNGLKTALEGLSNVQGLQETNSKIQNLKIELGDINITELQKFLEIFQNGQGAVGDMTNQVRGFTQANNDAAVAQQRTNSEIDQLKSRIGYFFSLTNGVQLFKRAIRGAIQTVQELDKTMTQAAVVTEFDVGYMWSKLPEYAANASKLGVSINEMYQATTLYYQQGLKTNEAMTLGVETMKMAKIAGMESAEATQAMTAALRGFNMELNETSATRVNDVYSQLAAVTAADTEQIATAMSKTASIAASANMEFETTAALLAQIIETTQEAPETAGTAMKTIIARFAEVKSLQNSGKTTGQDEEGEEIDVNKIQTALRQVGISMDEFFSGQEGLDQVLLKLAEKWKTLDFETQRYIATMAAGSRQQSRFIAMMSDYDRTMQLVSMANNSAGASQTQFDKTLESLESKLKKLQAAWQQFVMTISNNQLIKGAVDLLTGLLNAINNITGKLPGMIGSFANLALVFSALRAGGAIFRNALNGIGKIMASGFITPDVKAIIEAKAADLGKSVANTSTAATQTTLVAESQSLLATYNLVLAKVQAQLHPIKATIVADNAAITGCTMSMRQLQIEMEKVALSSGKDSAAFKELQIQYKKLLVQQVRAIKSCELEGVSLEKLNLFQKRLLAAKIEEGAITQAQLSLLDAETIRRYTLAVAVGDEATQREILAFAQQTEQNLKRGGITAFLTEIGLRMMNITRLKAEKNAVGDLIVKLKKLAAERIKKNAALINGASLVIAIVAAITLLIVGIVKLSKAISGMKDGTLELEKLNNQIKELSEQAQEAAEEMNSIADSRNELESLQETFKDLNKGTDEWRKNLIETNLKVMELVEAYPKLANYITKDSNGILQVTDEGWDLLEQESFSRYNAITQGLYGAQAQKIAGLQEVLFEGYQTEHWQKINSRREALDSEQGKAAGQLIGGGIGLASGAVVGGAVASSMVAGMEAGTTIGTIVPGLGSIIGAVVGALLGAIVGGVVTQIGRSEDQLQMSATGGLTEDQFTKLATLAAERNVSHEDLSGLQKIFEELGYDQYADWSAVSRKIQLLGDQFDKLALQAYELEIAQQVYVGSFITQAVTSAGLDTHSNAQQIAEIGGYIYKDVDQLIKEEVESKPKKLSEDEKLEYSSLTGKSVDQINKELKDGSLSEETIRTVIASNKIQTEAQGVMKKTADELERLGRTAKQVASLFNMLTPNGGSIKYEDIKDFYNAQKGTDQEGTEISNEVSDEDAKIMVENYLASKGTSLAALGLTGENDWRMIWDNLVYGSEALIDANNRAQKIGGSIDDRIGSAAASGVVNAVEEQLGQGSEGGGLILNKISSFISENDLDADQAQIIYELLSDIDWDNAAEVKDLSKHLEGLGFNMDFLGGAINDLEEDIIHFANSTYNLTPDEKGKLVENAQGLMGKISSEGRGRAFTKDEVGLFSDRVQEDFIRIGNAYYYTGTLTDAELIEDIQTNTGTKLSTEGSKEAYQNKTEAQNSSGFYTVKNVQVEEAEGTTYAKQNDNYGIVFAVEGGMEERYGTQYNSYQEFFESQDWQDELFYDTAATNFPYEYKIYQLYEWNKRNPLPGLTPDATADEVAAWYNGLDTAGKEHYGAIVANNKEGNQYAIDIGYGYGTYTNNATTQVVETNDWDVLGKMAGGEWTAQDNGEHYVIDENGETQLSEQDIERLYRKYIPEGTAETPEEMYNELVAWYNDTKTKSGDMTQTDFYQEMAMMDAQEIYDSTNSEFETESDAAKDYIEGQINSMAGGVVLVEKWTKVLEESGLEIEGNEYAIKAMAIAYDKANQKIDAMNEVLADQKEAFRQGPAAGQAYLDALQRITAAVQNVLGDTIDSPFVEQHRDLFLQLAEGGAQAEEAWKKITKLSFDKWLESADISEEVKQDMQDLSNYIDGLNLQVGVPVYLDNVEGMVEDWDSAVAAMASQGITLMRIPGKKDPDGMPIEYKYVAVRTGAAGSGFQSRSGGGGGKWTNSYEKDHNALKEINDLLRERERIELRYQRLLDRQLATYNSIKENLKDLLENYQTEIQQQSDLKKMYEKWLDELIAENSDLSQYIYFETDSNGDKTIRINWETINAVEDQDKGSKIQEFYDKATYYLDAIYEIETTIEEAADAIYEELQKGRDEYFDLEEQTKEAVVNGYQKQIDSMEDVNKAINDANSKLLESMQEQIDISRQIRDNTKQEEEIGDKQRRLAYLSQDTSGANQLEILELQKEIEDAQESYTDTLIDQKISELQKQNDEAAEQRERQIEIAQAQLDHYVESGEIWNEVEALIAGALNSDGTVRPDSELMQILKDSANFEGLSTIGQMDWLKNIESMIYSGLVWLNEQGILTSYFNGETISFTTADGHTVSGVVQSDGTVKTADGQIYSNVVRNPDGTFSTTENLKIAPTEPEETEPEETYPYGKASETTGYIQYGSSGNYVKAIQYALDKLGYDIGSTGIDGIFGAKTQSAVKAFQSAQGISADGIVGDKTREQFKLKQYKTGGLADFTGPAWLDGTKSRPEYILNADQTKAFFELVDVLGSLHGSKTQTSQNNGDNVFDIDINVETIGDDYDIEQLADKIKTMIVEDAHYRNNNAISLMR